MVWRAYGRAANPFMRVQFRSGMPPHQIQADAAILGFEGIVAMRQAADPVGIPDLGRDGARHVPCGQHAQAPPRLEGCVTQHVIERPDQAVAMPVEVDALRSAGRLEDQLAVQAATEQDAGHGAAGRRRSEVYTRVYTSNEPAVSATGMEHKIARD